MYLIPVLLAVGLLLCVMKTSVADSGYEPAISEAVNDIINKTVDRDTLGKTSDRLSKFGDIYGSAKTVPENIKQAETGTKTAAGAGLKPAPTFWQKIDKLIMKTRNSNY